MYGRGEASSYDESQGAEGDAAAACRRLREFTAKIEGLGYEQCDW